MDGKSILLDTSFFIRLLNVSDPLHKNVLNFFRHFLEKDYQLKCSTISIAEYCVRGQLSELPLKKLEIVPFNIDHGIKAGEFARTIFANKAQLNLTNRLIIPNDTKLFAQAHTETPIKYFATSDEESIKVHKVLKDNLTVDFEMINIRNPLTTELGVLF